MLIRNIKIEIWLFIILLMMIFPFVSVSAASPYYVSNPTACPTDAFSQSCVGGLKVCGVNASSVISCYDNTTLNPPTSSANSSSGSSTASGGYYVDCYGYDSVVPYCNNNGLFVCLQNATCDSLKKVTVCTASQWANSTCGSCKTGYHDCDGNTANGCSGPTEQDGASCTTALGLPGTYNNCVCVGSILKLGSDSVSGTNVIQSVSYPALFVNGYNVGVGTSTPSSTLQVFGSGNVIDVSLRSIGGLDLTPTEDRQAVPLGYLKDNYQLKGIYGNVFGSGTGRYLTKWAGTAATSTIINSQIYDNGTNVGIGTTNPGAKLEIDYTSGSSTDVNLSSNYGIKIKNTAWQSSQLTGIEFWNGYQKVVPTSRIISQMAGSGSAGDNLLFQTQSDSATNPNPNQPTTKLIVTSNGNVGIGTTGPGAKLHIAPTTNGSQGIALALGVDTSGWSNTHPMWQFITGYGGSDGSMAINNDRWSNSLYFTRGSSDGSQNIASMLSSDSNQQFILYNATTTATNVVLSSNGNTYFNGGNVGIGTTNPLSTLGINGVVNINPSTSVGNYDEGIRIGSKGGYSVLVLGADASSATGATTGQWGFYKDPNNNFEHRYMSTNVFTIFNNGSFALGSNLGPNPAVVTSVSNPLLLANTATGNVGIASTSPVAKLGIGVTGRVIHLGNGGTVAGLTTPTARDEAVNLGYLQDNYNPTSTLLWNGAINGNIYNNNSGNVGIGTTNPEGKLQVEGDLYFDTTTGTKSIKRKIGASWYAGLTLTSADVTLTGTQGVILSSTGYGQIAKFQSAGSYIGLIQGNQYYPAAKTLVLQEGASQTASILEWQNSAGTGLGAINAAGNVGIGTTNPLVKLDIQATTTDGLIVRTDLYKTASLYNLYYDTGALDLFNKTDKRVQLSAWGNNYIMDKLGIGTTTPVGLLSAGPMHVFNNGGSCGSNTRVIIGTPGVNVGGDQCAPFAINQPDPNGFYYGRIGSTNAALEFGMTTGLAAGYFNTKGAIPLAFWINGTERMRLDAAGNLGIGITNPGTRLTFATSSGQNINVGGGSIFNLNSVPLTRDYAVPRGYVDDNFFANGGNSFNGAATLGTNDNFNLNFETNSTTKMVLNTSGYLGIGTTTPAARLQVKGGLILNHTSVADANYTATADDYVIGYTSLTANRVVTLPNSLCIPGRYFAILDESGSAGSGSAAITIDPEGSTNIIGSTTLTINGPYNSVYVFCGGNNQWFIL